MRYAIGDQYAIFEGHIADDKPMVEQWRTGRWRKKQNLSQFLRIYIPEFAEAFETAARKRFALLARAEFATEPTHERVNALNASSEDLQEALIQLRAFMRNTGQP
jgi:hypothetical protein